ncbi:MAG TPA: citrate synthase, partial [Polyangiales bacterium]|nr:citrate synthase [Polyangiales bacterium]
MNEDSRQYLSAADAARRLGVKLDTIYAYVSRGLLSRHGTEKQSRFEVAQVERLALRGRRGVAPKAPTLIITTELTEVTPDAVRYRGRSALELARTEPFERIAEWLWSVPLEAAQPF